MYYGNLVTDQQDLAKIQWPVLGIFGDQVWPLPNEIYIYEGVGHAFANPSGDNYAPEEAADAWKKTLAFLNRNL